MQAHELVLQLVATHSSMSRVLNHCVAIHGGAGGLSETEPALLGAMRHALSAALDSADAVLTSDGSALDAVVAAVQELETAECFNAGRGAALRADGSARLDASLVCGATGRAGAVTGVRRVRHPIRLAQRLLEAEGAVLLAGEGADRRAAELLEELEAPDYFVTPRRELQLQGARARRRVELDHDGNTVGAVALDSRGNLAAATSTGGMTNAHPARVGDSPIVGAGTWARNESCAVSATGTGEAFLRSCFAHDVHARQLFAQCELERAAREALAEVQRLGGEGGCVAVDAAGNLVAPFVTRAMPHALRDREGRRSVQLFAEEPST